MAVGAAGNQLLACCLHGIREIIVFITKVDVLPAIPAKTAFGRIHRIVMLLTEKRLTLAGGFGIIGSQAAPPLALLRRCAAM